MSVWKRLVLDGRLVVVAAAVGVALKLFHMALAKPRGIRDKLLVIDAEWAAGMAVILGWALVSVRRGPADGRAAGVFALVVCAVGVAGVVVELVGAILHPSWL